MKKKLFCVLLVSLLANLGVSPLLASAADYVEIKEGTYWVNTNQLQSAKRNKRSAVVTTDETFEKKTEAERAALPAEEKAIVESIEQYLNDEAKQKGRSLMGDTLDNAVVSLAFDFGFKRSNPLFGLIAGLFSEENDANKENVEWYNSLTNISERTLTVYDEPTGKNIVIRANYIDNGAKQTFVLHNGYRATTDMMYKHAKFYSDEGFNVLLPDTRSHNSSEGEYITFGYYEKDDLNKWIDQEAALKPQQDIYLLGVSLGAATTMMSQATPNPHVKAYIEDCGYDSLEQQLRDTLHLLTQYFEYIPVVNWMDWYKKEGELIHKLNEQRIKPVLKFDLYTVSPFESVASSGLPKLFIHGDADWFIPSVAKEKLYVNAIGYKEQLTVTDAGHAESLNVAEESYKQTVLSFIRNVKAMESKMPVVAPNVNLLQNPTFNLTDTNFIDWETSTTFDNSGFTMNPLSKNSYDEFILKSSDNKDVVTAVPNDDGIRFFTKNVNNDGFAGQDVTVVKDETYELTFNAKNETNAAFTYPHILYGIDTIKKEDSLKFAVHGHEKLLQYTADETKTAKVKIGAKLGYDAFYDFMHFAHSTINDIQLINTDRTPPTGLQIETIMVKEAGCLVRGKAESNSKILVESQEGILLLEATAAANGSFEITLSRDQGTIFHLFNTDVKGNRSESRVLLFQ